ncbi:MAG: HEAT repeat domain-containing protein [Planctomycetota bacterium]
MIRTSLILACVALLGGCSGVKRTCRRLVDTTSPRERIAMAFDLEDPDLRRQGIAAMTEARGWDAEPYLKAYATLAGDPDPLVRGAALGALGRAGASDYLDVVVGGLDDRHRRVRLDAAEALETLHGDAAVEPLRRCVTEAEDADLRARCARALRHYRTRPVLDTLVAALNDEAFAVRYEARCSLRAMTGEDAAYSASAWRRLLADRDDPFAAIEPADSDRSWWRLW